MAVAITPQDLSAEELRREAARGRDANVTRRVLAIALVLEGHSREDAAEMCGMAVHCPICSRGSPDTADPVV